MSAFYLPDVLIPGVPPLDKTDKVSMVMVEEHVSKDTFKAKKKKKTTTQHLSLRGLKGSYGHSSRSR